MHKFETIRLIIIGTSIMLTVAAIPFFNTNPFSNAMAIQYSPYINNYYNDNDNNYYEQSNHDYYNYDDNDISYNSDNNYYYENKYLTKEKKYECRTGPFEGFFVSSPEFCMNETST